jgi:hypothetical protein
MDYCLEKYALPQSFTHLLVPFRRVPVPAERLFKLTCFFFRPFVSLYVTSPERPYGRPRILALNPVCVQLELTCRDWFRSLYFSE